MFMTIVHADWSIDSRKRWVAVAQRIRSNWHIAELSSRPPNERLLDNLLAQSREGSVIAGFDFPIGLPAHYGSRTGLPSFVEALSGFGSAGWNDFYRAAETPDQISIARPFYPMRSKRGTRRIDLCEALGVETFDELRRRCERQTKDRGAACPLFWTLGGNQVGKASITGWQEIVVPAVRQGAALWPFDGSLADLAAKSSLVIAETYPAEAYRHVGCKFSSTESKRNVMHRLSKVPAIFAWACDRHVTFESSVEKIIRNGCESDRYGEDRFDALIGLLGMLDVVMKRRSDGAPNDDAIRRWEGWIFGQSP